MYSSHRFDSVTCLRFSSRWMAAQSGSIRRRWPCFVPALANSLASSTASVISSGSGQLRPAAWKRASVARTVEAATPIRRAISRIGKPPTNFNRRTSRTWRMTILSAGIRSSFGSQRNGPESGRQRHLSPGRNHPGLVGDIISESWAASTGISRQGSVISPLLANIYLFYVLDLYAERWRRREASGDVIIVRYADDFIIGFEHETDAKCFLDLLRERMGKFALALHPEKTRLIEFGRHAAANRQRRRLGKPETFNFLGFTLICGKTRRGGFLVHRKTRRDRMRAKLQEITQELRQQMHQPNREQGRWLKQVVGGYFRYHAVPTNSH